MRGHVKTVCIHQPDFAPYLGFFDRLLHSDHFIILDNVQFINDGWQHRDRIRTTDGTKKWLTLSYQKGHGPQKISEVRLAPNGKWIESNLHLLQYSYSKAPFFDLIFPQIKAIYLAGHEYLIDFNMAFLDFAFRLFCIDIKTSFASEYPLNSSSSQRLVDLVNAVQGNNYLTGPGSRDYLDEELFVQANLQVSWQSFKHPVYPQTCAPFEPMLSCLDLFFACGENAALVLRGTTRD